MDGMQGPTVAPRKPKSVQTQDLFASESGRESYAEGDGQTNSVSYSFEAGGFLSNTPLDKVPPLPLYSSNASHVRYWENSDVDLIVLPSLTIDAGELKKITGVVHYEERQLFNLIMLRQPKTRLIYLTSLPLDPSIIEYYLTLIPDVSFKEFRRRLIMVSPHDSSFTSLSQKLLERPMLMARVKALIRPGKSCLTCFNSTVLEQRIARLLEIPLLANNPELAYWGTKAGSRKIFAECGIPHPAGIEEVRSVDQLAEALAVFWEAHPDTKRMVVKLNESFSGEGNAVLDFRPISKPVPATHAARVEAVMQQLKGMAFAGTNERWETYSARIPDLGAIAELFLDGECKTSPSVQVCLDHEGHPEVLSTHEQILGGDDGQVYLGCRFPASDGYRMQLQAYGQAIGRALASRGVLDHFAADFLVRAQETAEDGTVTKWDVQALEINLRMGGTTHPMMTLKLLTRGQYSEKDGFFYAADGRRKFYIASDNLQKSQYRGLLPVDLRQIISDAGLHFDHETQHGAVFHLLGALSEYGKVGITCIADSLAEAEAIYERVVQALDAATAETLDHLKQLKAEGKLG